ncbi:MAG: tetratricopeptide repeat protein [Bacteroidota bacterium]|nr:tetratricopeptide repeat protein [Bacteroidota bacterium]
MPFERSSEARSGEAIEEFRGNAVPSSASKNTLIDALPSNLSDDRNDEVEQLFSLSEFEHSHLVFAQNILQKAIENEPNASTKKAEALLLAAIQSLSSSLSPAEKLEAGNKIKAISPGAFASEPRIDGEYKFWLAEILRSEHDIHGAIEAYTAALEKNVDGGFGELVRFRRAELYEHELQYIAANRDFDSLASQRGHVLRLVASLRRASLLRSMGEFRELLTETSRASILAADSSQLVYPHDPRDVRYHSLFAANRLDQPEVRDTLMLASPLVQEEISLLKGTGFSGLRSYDSAEYYLTQAERSLEAQSDYRGFRREKRYLQHALLFEHGWIRLSVGDNDGAARIFLSLSQQDTAEQRNPLFSGSSSDNTGLFYHDESVAPAGNQNPQSMTLDTSRFIYDDYPARARFYAGIALSRAGKVAEARDVLTNLSQDPAALYSDKARYNLALVEFKSGHSLQAEGLLAPIAMRRTQSGVFASILLGDIHYRRSSFAKASEYFAFALANLPDNDTSLRSVAALERGLSLLPLGSWNESAEDLKLYVSLAAPGTVGLDEALFWLGRAYFRGDSILQARNCFKRVLEDFPKSSRAIDAQYGYAWTLFRNGEYDSAEKEFAKVIELDSITRYAYDALSRRGDALYAGGNLRKALAIYNLAVDRPTFNDYRTTRSLYQLGVLRMRSDSARSAMNAFRTIMTKFPKSDILDRAYYNYAAAGFAIKQDENAVEAISQLVKKFKDSPFAVKGLYLLASERERSGKFDEAYRNYRKIIKEYPASDVFIPSVYGAINSLVQSKKYDDAIALCDTFLARLPEHSCSPALLYRKGEIQLLASSPKDAQQTFEEFSARFPNDTLLPMARYMLAKSLSFTNKSKAHALYQEIGGLYPHSMAAPFAYLALARLERNEHTDLKSTADYYSKAFAMEYYSSEAAPQAMFEYGNFLRNDLAKLDSALNIYSELTNRYFIETTIGAKAQLESADILLAQGKRSEAMSRLEKVATAQEGYELAAEARIHLGQLYKSAGMTKRALAEFDRAREDNTTTRDQLARSYLGSAECHIATGDKKQARQILAEMLVTRGIPRSRRDAATQLLDSITPKKKKKRR